MVQLAAVQLAQARVEEAQVPGQLVGDTLQRRRVETCSMCESSVRRVGVWGGGGYSDRLVDEAKLSGRARA